MGLMDWLRPRSSADDDGDEFYPGHGLGWSFALSKGPYATELSVSADAKQALTLSAVYRSTALLTGLAGMLPIEVQTRDVKGYWAPDENNRWYDPVVYQPNPYQSSQRFRKLAQAQFFFNGETFWWPKVDGKKRSILPLPPHRMHPRRQQEDGKVVWAYHAPDGKNYELVAGEDLIHTVGITLDGLRGCSMLEAMKRTTSLGITMEKYGLSHFSNSPMMKGILIPKRPLGPKQRKALTDSFTKAFAGEKNWHNIPVLPTEMVWESIGINNSDSQFLETRTYSILEFARFTGIPAVLLMHTDKSSVYANAQRFFQAFVDFDFAIWLSMFHEAYDSLFRLNERKKTRVRILTADMTRGDRETRFKTYKIGREIGVWSPNDIRRMEGEPSRTGGDTYIGDVEQSQTGTTQTRERESEEGKEE